MVFAMLINLEWSSQSSKVNVHRYIWKDWPHIHICLYKHKTFSIWGPSYKVWRLLSPGMLHYIVSSTLHHILECQVLNSAHIHCFPALEGSQPSCCMCVVAGSSHTLISFFAAADVVIALYVDCASETSVRVNKHQILLQFIMLLLLGSY